MKPQIIFSASFTILACLLSFCADAQDIQTNINNHPEQQKTSITSRGTRPVINSINTQNVQKVSFRSASEQHVSLIGSRGSRFKGETNTNGSGYFNRMLGNGKARGTR